MKSLAQLLPDYVIKETVMISTITSDSRQVIPGSLFFAYAGDTVDGRDYIHAALENGAVAVVYDAADGYCIDHVESDKAIFIAAHAVRDLVGKVAARFFDMPCDFMKIIGVTGTNGKTSITHFIAQALQAHRVTCGVLGTLGNGLLTALAPATHTTQDAISLQKNLHDLQQQGATHVAMEVSSHALVQSRVSGVRFDTAVFSQISRDHLDYHGTMAAYQHAKSQLFLQPGLVNAVINYDDALGRTLIARHASHLDIIAYSLSGSPVSSCNMIRVMSVKSVTQGFLVKIDSKWGKGEFLCRLLGAFNISNTLAVIGVLLHQGIDFHAALAACANLIALPGRMQCLGGGVNPRVVIDYAHTPDALKQVLTTLKDHCQGRLFCVFGCGGDRDRGKRVEMGRIAAQMADQVVVTTDNPRNESPQAIVDDILASVNANRHVQVVLDRADAIREAIKAAVSGDIVLIAGKGHESTQIVGNQSFFFNDAEHAIKYL